MNTALKLTDAGRRHVRLVKLDGELVTYEQLALKFDLTVAAVKARIKTGKPLSDECRRPVKRRGWSSVEYQGTRYTWAELSRKLGVSEGALKWRHRHGKPLDTPYVAKGSRLIADHPRRKHNEAYPGANDKPWEEDAVARRLVQELGPMTHATVAAVMGCDRERIRQIEARALRKLARYLKLQREYTSTADMLDERLLLSASREVGYQRNRMVRRGLV